MNCKKIKIDWLKYCEEILNLKYKCIRPVDCLGNDIRLLTCFKIIKNYKKYCK